MSVGEDISDGFKNTKQKLDFINKTAILCAHNKEKYMQTVYVVTMQRWGDEESHNYVLGTFSSEDKALEAGQIERSYRGCKYEPMVTICVVDRLEKDKNKIPRIL